MKTKCKSTKDKNKDLIEIYKYNKNVMEGI
ncbi:hypothetical protein CM240_0269 [Clostridium bornimense]|uniref:Uncharacterized protein n=1 Tax=Clostridium bornimense TaxID=1216932 RepID=W6RV12_9CLOT|nr:hypothetical protein CM240_0269 [Clostridium bornimense]